MRRNTITLAALLSFAGCAPDDNCLRRDGNCSLLALLTYYPWQASCTAADPSSQSWSTSFTDAVDSEFGFDVCARGGTIFLLSQANVPFASYSGLNSTTPQPAGQSMAAVRYNLQGQALSFAYIGADPNTVSAAQIAPALDGGVLLLGIVDGAISNLNMNIQRRAYVASVDSATVKMDANGVPQWFSHYGGAGNDFLRGVAPAPLGGYFLAGDSNSSNALSDVAVRLPPTGEQQAWLVRLDAAGNPIWQTYVGGAGADSFSSVQALPDGGALAVGGTNISFTAGGLNPLQAHSGGNDLMLARFNAHGDLMWFSFFGDGGNQFGSGLAVVDQTIVVSGNTAGGPASFNGLSPYTPAGGASDGLYVEFDFSGNTTRYGIVGGAGNEQLNSVLALAGGGYLLVGDSTTIGSLAGKSPLLINSGSNDFVLVRFAGPGAGIDWWSFYGSAAAENGGRVAATASGDLILAGNSVGVISGAPTPIIAPLGGGDDAALFRLRSNGQF
ncbi:MAG: hypothetical protein K1X75_11565 [Leptospirales bacterium]|nr:hypothetical protein [Leptospirales bacterium]